MREISKILTGENPAAKFRRHSEPAFLRMNEVLVRQQHALHALHYIAELHAQGPGSSGEPRERRSPCTSPCIPKPGPQLTAPGHHTLTTAKYYSSLDCLLSYRSSKETRHLLYLDPLKPSFDTPS